MTYLKNIKTNAYFSRYQVKYRRRRSGKTDYRARLRLTRQSKNKFASRKYRLVVRFTNKDIVCQIVSSTITHDEVFASAYAHELPEYGLKVGLSNYSAAYCVGLLVARRALTKLGNGMAEAYEGCTEPDGEDFCVEEQEDGPRPFTVLLDTGLKRTSTGSKVFACLKGALDGGLNIPHNEKRFVGYSPDDKELDAEILRKYIFGGHVAEYMEEMEEDDPDKYTTHFSQYHAEEVEYDNFEEMYEEVHAAIRENPMKEKKVRSNPGGNKRWKTPKLTYTERKAALKEKLAALMD